jgi:UDP-glucuronate 4-epimerase
MDFIAALEKCFGKALGREVVFGKVFEPLKAGDVPATYASTDLLQEAVGFKPYTGMEEGLQKFADWYVEYYKVK